MAAIQRIYLQEDTSDWTREDWIKLELRLCEPIQGLRYFSYDPIRANKKRELQIELGKVRAEYRALDKQRKAR